MIVVRSLVLRFVLFLILLAFPGLFSEASDANERCTQDPSRPPCRGSPGRCTRNQDWSPGGFVANTASVEKGSSWFNVFRTNGPYISKYAQICDSAQISGSASVVGNAQVYGQAQVAGNAIISGEAQVFENASIYGNARITENAQIFGSAEIHGDAFIGGTARVYWNTQISGNSFITEGDWAEGNNIRSKILDQSGIRINTYDQNPLDPQLLVTAQKCLSELAEDKLKPDADQFICPHCLELIDEKLTEGPLIYTRCHHFICKACFDQALERHDRCPVCGKAKMEQGRLEIEKHFNRLSGGL